MCGQLARAWGNQRFGPLEPAEEVCLAAEQHEVGMGAWDLEPELDLETGLPRTVTAMDPDVHLPLRMESPRRLMAQSRYAALLVSLHHTSFYDRPASIGLLRRAGRQIRDYLEQSAALQARLRETVEAGDPEIERNWRLVRTFDGLSHDLLYDRAPCGRGGVPAADGALVELSIERRHAAHTIDPWPFTADRVLVRSEGRLLAGMFSDERSMREALVRAPWIDIGFELVPG